MKTRIFSILLGGAVVISLLQNDKNTSIPTPGIQTQSVKKSVKSTSKKKIVKTSELDCLAKNIFYEAGNQGYTGRLAVATVTMNRVKSKQFPSTVCGVVYQRGKHGCQFSWTCGSKAKFNAALYRKSYSVAKEVLTNNKRLRIIKEALYFHNSRINPNWTFATPVAQIGDHIFYIKKSYDS